MPERMAPTLSRFQQLETDLCLACNRIEQRWITALFSLVSWLGNGLFWMVMLVVVMLVDPASATAAATRLIASAVLGTLVYKLVKQLTARARPCHAGFGIRLLIEPLDRYSFPSGHTMHAVSFTMLIAHHAPALIWLVLPFTVLVALSRVVLGLHYPTDVAAGVALGIVLATNITRFL